MNNIAQSFEVRAVRAIDLYKFCEILMDATRWFENDGEAFWDRQQIVPHTILAHYRIDELFLGYVDKQPVAAMIFNNRCHWPQISESQRRASLFVHKLAVTRESSGKGYSEKMLDWAYQQSVSQGYNQLILLCNCYHNKLRQLWQRFGFNEINSQDEQGELNRYYVQPVELGKRLGNGKGLLNALV
ncbi:GNAT family N-acetyltransferase [Celerinatantimonas sp. MCCC 1A17872]|uniref:GNAT family N-acetyltransferase n=1 Tax=Celerinatantimonas sp. MCCC 1A17872 TaxID=3177514 RepID=UPI0038C23DC4